MLKNLQKSLRLSCKRFKTKDVWDIVLYGSSVKGSFRPRDLDIMIIFLEGKLRDRLDKIQELKNNLRGKEFKDIDVKSMLLRDFFDKNFLARQGILLEGISLINSKSLAEQLGFKAFSLFTYNLSGLTHTLKIRFNYALKGRTSKGLLDDFKGKSLGKGVLIISMEKSNEFESFLQKWKINYKIKRTLFEI